MAVAVRSGRGCRHRDPGRPWPGTGSSRPYAGSPLLISSGVIGLISVIAGTVVKMHDATQRTRRLQIEHEGRTAIAKAMAKVLDDAHAAAEELPPDLRAAEAASVRATAMQTVAQIMSAMLAVTGQQDPDRGEIGTVHPVGKSRLGLPGNAGKTA